MSTRPMYLTTRRLGLNARMVDAPQHMSNDVFVDTEGDHKELLTYLRRVGALRPDMDLSAVPPDRWSKPTNAQVGDLIVIIGSNGCLSGVWEILPQGVSPLDYGSPLMSDDDLHMVPRGTLPHGFIFDPSGDHSYDNFT